MPNNAADGNGEIVAQQLPLVYATGCFGLLVRERNDEKENETLGPADAIELKTLEVQMEQMGFSHFHMIFRYSTYIHTMNGRENSTYSILIIYRTKNLTSERRFNKKKIKIKKKTN